MPNAPRLFVLREFLLVGNRQLPAALAAASGQNGAALGGAHSLEEAVLTLARNTLRLVGALAHISIPVIAWRALRRPKGEHFPHTWKTTQNRRYAAAPRPGEYTGRRVSTSTGLECRMHPNERDLGAPRGDARNVRSD